MADNDLPEGTDSIVPGAGAGGSGDTRSDLEPRSAAAERGDGERESANNRADGFDDDDDEGEDFGADVELATSDTDVETTATGGKSFTDTLAEGREGIADKAAGFKGQATDKARQFAIMGKDRAVGQLDNVARLIDDAANTVDEKVGEQYGGYVRQASQALTSLSDSLRDKDVDELFDDAREVVRKSPAVAIGAAAAIGFVLARVVTAGIESARAPSNDETVG